MPVSCFLDSLSLRSDGNFQIYAKKCFGFLDLRQIYSLHSLSSAIDQETLSVRAKEIK